MPRLVLLFLVLFITSNLKPTTVFAQSPTPIPGCGLSCGSNPSICSAPLTCGTTGVCRHVSCPESPDCVCPPWYNPTLNQFRGAVIGDPTNPTEQRTLHAGRYAYAQLTWVINSIALILNENMHPDSLEAVRSLFTFLPFRPPASGLAEIGRFLSRFDLASPTSAQGFGYNASWALQSVWAAMRNSAYLVMVILLVAAGFMIMFRVKTGPQSALTLPSLIPRIIITLLGITFSFALAGFIIDLVYLTVAFFVVALNPIGIVTDIPAALNFFASPGYFEKLIAYYLLPYVLVIVGVLLIGGPAAILALISTLPGIIGVIVFIVLILTTLLLLARVWWTLVRTYISLIFLIILAPWMILLGLFPSAPDPRRPSLMGLSGWLRAFIAHAAVFAIVPLLFLAQIAFWRFPVDVPVLQEVSNFLGSVFSQLFTGVNQVPTSGNFPSFPLFSGQGGIFDLVISWVILALIPKTANMLKDVLKVTGLKSSGTALTEALGPSAFVGKGGAQYGMGFVGSRLPDIAQASQGQRLLDKGLSLFSGLTRIPYRSPYQ